MTFPSPRPTRERVDAALADADLGSGSLRGDLDRRTLAAEVRALRAEVDVQEIAFQGQAATERWLRAELAKFRDAIRPRTDPSLPQRRDDPEEIRARIAALTARTPQPAEPSALVLAAEEACAAIERLNPDASEGTPIWDGGPDGEHFPDEIRQLFQTGDALMREIDRATGPAAPQVADQPAPHPPADPHLAHYLSLPTHDLAGLRETLIEGKGNAALLSAVEQEIARRDRLAAPQPAVPDGEDVPARLRELAGALHVAGWTGVSESLLVVARHIDTARPEVVAAVAAALARPTGHQQ